MALRTQRTKRNWSIDLVQVCLEVMDDYDEEVLPRSAASRQRASSPAPGSKRKSDSTLPPSTSKRARPDRPSQIEEGELSEDASGIHRLDPSSYTAIHRIRRGIPPTSQFSALHIAVHNSARRLKYSGDSRFLSSHAPSNREYRPLANPPPTNSAYYKHSAIIARIEQVDALIRFSYALWAKDYSRPNQYDDSWNTMKDYHAFCRSRWQSEGASSDAEKAILGLIIMLDGYITGRKNRNATRKLHFDIDPLVKSVQQQTKAKLSSSSPAPPKPADQMQMLPSPASSGAPNSANSTPTNRQSIIVMPASAPPRPSGQQDQQLHISLLPSEYHTKNTNKSIPQEVYDAANNATVTYGPRVLSRVREVVDTAVYEMNALGTSSQTLNLNILEQHFPRTYARMGDHLKAHEDYEPDFDDEECVLRWPHAGYVEVDKRKVDGLGWACLLGHSMLLEFGSRFGYIGLKGAVLKPSDPEVSAKPTEDVRPPSHPSPPPQRRPAQGGAARR
ncbi:hypothetical protein CYLTODRAFT_454718 [Cylindrobasidium torrendii FP15055 ss-10]|uniref:Uncharacterized protein n=1 Tax=Cylindrobasidium torrendii FP15055 ss-10 TaxID=1314674 RepID=A0A0D7BAK0_9AGAR|nr:hypothetical protein CYLTODRAFT_454718 [Cylindrobasidium torrendii FP15055 ss-10]